jgi:predicted PurR-regulated permease PerM
LNKITSKQNRNFLLHLAGFVIIIAGMREASSILIPFMLSVFIAILFAPPFIWLQKKVPTFLALIIVIISILLVGALLAVIIETSVADFANTLPVYQSRFEEFLKQTATTAKSLGLQLPDQILLDYFDPGSLMGLVGSMLSGVGGLLSNTFLIIFTVLFMLLESTDFSQKLKHAFSHQENSMEHFEKFTENIKQYMVIKTTISLATGLLVFLWLLILGVDYPVLWGLLAFLLNYIPTIGSIIAAVPAVLLALIQIGVSSSLFVAAGYLTVNFVMGSIIEPKFMGRGLGLSTLVVFLSLVFWGWVFGAIGMLLSVPLTMMAKIALDSNPQTQWLATLLGPQRQGTIHNK